MKGWRKQLALDFENVISDITASTTTVSAEFDFTALYFVFSINKTVRRALDVMINNNIVHRYVCVCVYESVFKKKKKTRSL